ncbi:MAG: PfkB family carbohydrate kinase [Planctomycetaceae bacterium]|nr:PfkB family carbohydrate kinase [Planctomycetaceae bacterium]
MPKPRLSSGRFGWGGITANALAAAASLGVRCGFAGTLGHGDASSRVLDELAAAGVDTALIRREADAQPIRSTIITSRRTGSRTILYDLAGAIGATTEWPPEDTIRSAAALLIDHFGMEGMLRAAKIAAGAGIPIVGDFECDQRPEFGELLALVDHLIVSRDFARRITRADDPARAVSQLWTDRRQLVAVTCGSEGCLFRAADMGAMPQHVPAIALAVHDTTGCGDVFRGAYAAALLRDRAGATAGLPSSAARTGGQATRGTPSRSRDGALARIRFATAAAALRAAATTPAESFPDRAAVNRLFAQTWPMP